VTYEVGLGGLALSGGALLGLGDIAPQTLKRSFDSYEFLTRVRDLVQERFESFFG
jgi:hypothetical protein